ncbi:hypothetical protein Cni_G18631 [Canna indica]|uniref:FAD-binding PCMH-type domain-containing protein n=1 Tax=Canna indica TaxID=4628 RepID=A0AAQ3KMN2_9LILI|nr:hypothetical protein Cni_G18631 [Canna indica]
MAAMSPSLLFVFSLLLLLIKSYANSTETSFLECFLNTTRSDSRIAIAEIIYAPNTTSYNTIFLSSIQNIRFLLSGNTTKPSFVVLPVEAAHVQAAVVCGRRHGLRLRVRSGGHDYEGLSYVSAGGPFVILDISQLRSISFPDDGNMAWVGAGAIVGEVYYNVGLKNATAGFPAGICTTIGVGGHFSGGGIGSLQRKYGSSADNIVDALIVNADGEILDKKSMGEDLFWAIRGGGAASFGVVLYYKIKLVYVPPQVTVFTISRTLKQNATKLLEKWQYVAPELVNDLWIRTIVLAINEASGDRTIQVLFQGMFLGGRDDLLPLVHKSFPELDLKAEDCSEMRWVESTLYIAFSDIKNLTMLLDRRPQYNSSFKAKSDFVRNPISEEGWEEIWKFMTEAKDEPLTVIMEPWGGRISEITDTAIAFPHRKGNLYNIQYFMRWSETEEAVTEKHLNWMRTMYEFMAPYVSSNPRAAYVNYKDIDLGSSTEEGKTSYTEASAWGSKYFLNNYKRLAKVKAEVDPEGYFWNEQGIPPFSS